MKTILMLAHDDEGQEARLQTALDLARACGAHLTCLDLAQPPIWVADYVTTAGAMIAFAEEETREQLNVERLKRRLADEDVPWDVQTAIGEATPALVAQAAFADAVVVDCRAEGARITDPRSVAAATAAGVRGLVLAVPETLKRFDVFAPAMIAWDGSAPAAAAVRRAIPLLARAERVALVTVGEEAARGYPAEAAARYLSRYDIHVEVMRREPGSGGIDGTLRETAHSLGVGQIVMGVYGNSPLAQAIFGGVSRRMLATSDVPLLLGR
jgi:nucleotide-binding universal stress UspA family protein